MKGRLNAYAWDYLTDSNAWFLAPGKSKIQPTTMIVPQNLMKEYANVMGIDPKVVKDRKKTLSDVIDEEVEILGG